MSVSSTEAASTPDLMQLTPEQKRKESRRVILSSYLGSSIEFYDFLLYASASALIFPTVFFSDLDPLAGTIASYGTFAAGYLARPLGGARSEERRVGSVWRCGGWLSGVLAVRM